MRLASVALFPRPARSIAAWAMLALATVAIGSSSASAQSIEGGMNASLTIVEPMGSAAVKASPLTMSRSGVLSMDTTSPVAGPTSQIVMVDASEDGPSTAATSRIAMRSGTTERALVAGRAVPVGSNGIAPATSKAGDFRVSFLARVGASTSETVKLTVRYLAVAGT